MSKTSARLLAMLSLLQARRDWPGALLAERLEISPGPSGGTSTVCGSSAIPSPP